MIAFVRGTVAYVGVDRLVVDLSTVGVSVLCTATTALGARVGEQVELMTSMVVREDGWTLYGFDTADERSCFEQVQTVTGIGPRIALALLGTLGPDGLRRAVGAGDERAITAVPGIGRKGAQRIILELADRLGPAATGPGAPARADVGTAPWQQAVVAGLVSLGWSTKEAEVAVDRLDPDVLASAGVSTTGQPAQGQPDVGLLLKAALRGLDRA